MKNPKCRLARWVLLLRPYKVQITYWLGTQNQMADCLSRSPFDKPIAPIKLILTSSLLCISTNPLTAEQQNDTFCSSITSILLEGATHSHFKTKSRFFVIKRGVLYRINSRNNRTVLLLIIPKSKRLLLKKHTTKAHISEIPEFTKVSTKIIIGPVA